MDNKITSLNELVDILSKACNAYYGRDNPIMTDKQYDELYDDLVRLEDETGIVMSNSPTIRVQGEILDGLQKVKHSKPMLSAAKTKSIDEIKKFVGKNKFYCSYKLDGLTLVAIYDHGQFQRATTRGDGEFGEDVTEAAKAISNLPMIIPYDGYLELRGECVMSWENFRRANEVAENQYSHPRNLAAGTIRSLDTSVLKDRILDFVVFECVSDYGEDSKFETLLKLKCLGFEVVQAGIRAIDDCYEALQPEFYEYPVDGLIYELDSKEMSKLLGATSHHENCRMALKWADNTYETILRDIEWNPTRTGTLAPVAIFDEVDLDGALTTRATLHNVSYIEDLELGIGDTITVYRSNMVIPKIDDNQTRSNNVVVPTKCPVCGGSTVVKQDNESKVLYCTNDSCKGKLVGKLTHFVSKKAMNIDGLSEATLEKFMDMGWLKSLSDIYRLKDHEAEISKMEGFGAKSCKKLLANIENSRHVKMENFLASLGIPNIGKTASKALSKAFDGRIDLFLQAISSNYKFDQLDDFGSVANESIHAYMKKNARLFSELANIMEFETMITDKKSINNQFSSKTVVVTGSLEHFTRDSIQQKLEELGAKVSGSISKKTDYLIAGEKAGSKLTKAKDLGVKVITEKEFLSMI